jgi:hypothetical protein
MEALSSSETSVLTRAARGNIREDAILHSHRRGNLNSYIACVSELTIAVFFASLSCEGLSGTPETVMRMPVKYFGGTTH